MIESNGYLPADSTQEAPESEAEEGREPSRGLDIPVDSWDAYKSWCEKVKDCWDD